MGKEPDKPGRKSMSLNKELRDRWINSLQHTVGPKLFLLGLNYLSDKGCLVTLHKFVDAVNSGAITIAYDINYLGSKVSSDRRKARGEYLSTHILFEQYESDGLVCMVVGRNLSNDLEDTKWVRTNRIDHKMAKKIRSAVSAIDGQKDGLALIYNGDVVDEIYELGLSPVLIKFQVNEDMSVGISELTH